MLNYKVNHFTKRIAVILSSLFLLYALWSIGNLTAPYFIVCLMACLYKPYLFKNKYDGNIAKIGALLFSFLIVLGNFEHIQYFPIFTITGTIIFYALIQLFLNFEISYKERKALPVFFVTFAALTVTYLVYLFVFNYPGTLCIDSGEQLQQIISGRYWNHHPVWHTFTIQGFLAIGHALTHNWGGAIATYHVIQTLIFSASIAYGVMVIRNTKILFPIILAFILLPYHMNYATTMTKDTLFVAGMIVFVSVLYQKIKNSTHKGMQILFIASMFPICLYRTNGTILIAATLIASLFLLKRKDVLLPMIVVLGISYFLKYPMMSILNIAQPDLAEKTVMFYQQVGRVVAKDGKIEPKDLEMIQRLGSVNMFKDAYVENHADSIKAILRFRSLSTYEKNKWEYFNIWLRTGLANPGEYIEAFIAQSRFWYSPQKGNWVVYNFDHPGVSEYIYQKLHIISPVELISHPYLEAFLHLTPFVSVGLHVWVMLLLTIRTIIKRDKKILLLIPFLVMTLTLITSAPTMEFRYMYAWFSVLPIIIPMLFLKRLHKGSLFFIAYYK